MKTQDKDIERQARIAMFTSLFEKIKSAMLKQKARSQSDDGQCLYRGPNGLKCAVGVLIDDKYFNEEYNGKDVQDRHVLRMLEKSGYPVDWRAQDFYSEMQSVHDTEWPRDWDREFDLAFENFIETRFCGDK